MKYKFYILYIILFIAASLLGGCATAERILPSCCMFSIPTPQLTSEKTALERQIVGDYKELEKDAWIISSVRTSVQKGKGASAAAGDEKLLKAMKVREFHENKIRKYKDEGALGERNDGLIEYRSAAKYDSDSKEMEILRTVIDEENKARKTIFIRSLTGSGTAEPGEKDINAFGKIFAQEQAALAKKNDWVQEDSGMWIRKK